MSLQKRVVCIIAVIILSTILSCIGLVLESVEPVPPVMFLAGAIGGVFSASTDMSRRVNISVKISIAGITLSMIASFLVFIAPEHIGTPQTIFYVLATATMFLVGGYACVQWMGDRESSFGQTFL